MTLSPFIDIYERIKAVTGLEKNTDIADEIGIDPSTVSLLKGQGKSKSEGKAGKKTKNIPYRQLIEWAVSKSVDLTWLFTGQGACPHIEGEKNSASNVEPHVVDTELLEGAMAIHPEDLPTVELFKRFDNWLQNKSHREQGWYVTELLRKFPDFHDHLIKILADQAPAKKTGTDGTN